MVSLNGIQESHAITKNKNRTGKVANQNNINQDQKIRIIANINVTIYYGYEKLIIHP